MSFFIRKKTGGPIKRKAKSKPNSKHNSRNPQSKKKNLDEDILSESSGEENEGDHDVSKAKIEIESGSEDEREETVEEKRLRLAKKYLQEIEREEKERAEVEEVDKDAIAHRLQEDLLEQKGRLQKTIAHKYTKANIEGMRVLRGHQLPPTCLVTSSDDSFIYSGSKDSTIIKWCLKTGKKLKVIPRRKKGSKPEGGSGHGHTDHVLCLALSSDNKYLVSGCKSNAIYVWSADDLNHIHTFNGHRDSVISMAFRKDSHQLFSASWDRSVKIWDLDEMQYIETLFGHQEKITHIDVFYKERAITSGGRDGTIRIWKIVDESQLVYNTPPAAGSTDCVRFINEENFVSCSDDGSISLWSVAKKKPVATVKSTHGIDESNELSNWVNCVAPFPNSDLVASGSKDGYVNLWRCGEHFRQLNKLFSVPVGGFVNALHFSNSGFHLVAAVGQEHRLGRWWRLKEAKNSICVIPLVRDD